MEGCATCDLSRGTGFPPRLVQCRDTFDQSAANEYPSYARVKAEVGRVGKLFLGNVRNE